MNLPAKFDATPLDAAKFRMEDRPTEHLSEDQIDDHLIGELSGDAAAHLQGCAECQARVAAATAPLASFRVVSLAWAERRSATLPLRPEVAPRSRSRLAWAGAVAAVLALGVSLPVARQHMAARPSAQASAAAAVPSLSAAAPAPAVHTLAAVGHTGIKSVTPVAANPEQIARDNEMLEAIDRELDAPAEAPALYGLEAVAAARHARGHAAPLRD